MTTRYTGTGDDSKRDTEAKSKANLVKTSEGRDAESCSSPICSRESEGTHSSNTLIERQEQLFKIFRIVSYLEGRRRIRLLLHPTSLGGYEVVCARSRAFVASPAVVQQHDE